VRLFPRSAALVGSCLAALLTLSGCDRIGLGMPGASAPSFKGIDITGASYGRSLNLVDQHGQPRALSDFKGKVSVLFFGFTQCPDVCPTTMLELAQVKQSLGPDGERVQGIFVTIDPERDTPEVLKAYMASFDPSFVALRGNAAETAAAAKEFKVFYAKVPGKSEGSYTMDHTAGTYLIDPSGRLRLFVRHGTGAQALASDIKALLASG
jgi:protein SCO1/2